MANFKSCVYFPVVFLLLSVVGLLICYGVATSSGSFFQQRNESPAFVSDFGMFLPEGAVFALILNWGAIFLSIMCMVFYKYVNDQRLSSSLNISTLVFGCITSTGITVVACFPWRDNIAALHITGATMAFCGGMIQCWLICAITWKLHRGKSRFFTLFYVRICLAIFQSAGLILYGVFLSLIFFSDWKSRKPAVISEWIMLFAQLLFYASFSYEFNLVKFIELKLQYVDNASRTISGVCNEIVELETNHTQQHCEEAVDSADP